MIAKRSLVLVSIGLVAGLVIGGTVGAVAASSSSTVRVCVTGKGAVRSASKASGCPAGTRKRSINVAGPQGPTGPQGPAGPGAKVLDQTIVAPASGVAVTGTSMTANCSNTVPRVTLAAKNDGAYYGSYHTSGGPNGIFRRDLGNGGTNNVFDDVTVAVDVVEFDPATGRTSHVIATLYYFSGVCHVRGMVIPAA